MEKNPARAPGLLVWQDLNRDFWQLGDICQPPKLCVHHRSIAALPVQDGFIEDRRIYQRLITSQKLLADKACLQAPPDCPGEIK
jgi:hypothetical protein